MRGVILAGVNRTAMGTLGGAFASVPAAELGVVSAKAAFARSGVAPHDIDETIGGNVLQAGQGMNPARQVSLNSGIPEGVPAYTVNKVCGSGMKALGLAWQAIQTRQAERVLAGGIENMSRAPYLLPELRSGARLGHVQALDHMVHDGLTDVFNQYHMGITAENVAQYHGVLRETQDAFAAESQARCAAAMDAGRFQDEIAPVTVKKRKEEVVVDRDEHPRPGTTAEALGKLRAAFKGDGSVTAGNSSGINDGASLMIVAAAEAVPAGTGLAYLRDVRASGCDPAYMGMGPVSAVTKLLKANKLEIGDIDLWELNEAFAAQSLAVMSELGLPSERTNVNGGAIALGHPIGASGARIVTTLVYEMRRRGVEYGVASMCIGGGQGIACLVQNIG